MQIKFSLLLTIALALVATTTVKACDVCDDDYEVAPGADGGADGTGVGEGADGGAGAGGDATGVGAAGGAGDKAAIIAKLQADIALLKVACPAVQDNNAANPAANEAEGADPAANEAEGADPAANEAEGADPAANEAEGADPAANEAEGADPAANEAEAADPAAATDTGAAGGGATGDAGAAGAAAGGATGAAGAAQDFSQGGPIGDCTESPSIELIKGAAGRDPEEFVFQAGPNPIAAFSGQSVALNPKIIVDFLCNKLNDTCNNKAAQKVCTDFSATVQGKNGKVADDFNALFGKQTNFAAVGESGKPQA